MYTSKYMFELLYLQYTHARYFKCLWDSTMSHWKEAGRIPCKSIYLIHPSLTGVTHDIINDVNNTLGQNLVLNILCVSHLLSISDMPPTDRWKLTDACYLSSIESIRILRLEGLYLKCLLNQPNNNVLGGVGKDGHLGF